MRVTYVGELGWELHVPADQALTVYDALLEAGSAFGYRNVGMGALNSLRLEKAYRDFGLDIDNSDTPLDVGLGFAVAWDKPGGFIGRDALLAARRPGPPKRRLVQVLLEDPEPLLYHGEPVLRDGKWFGHVRWGGYGHTLGGCRGPRDGRGRGRDPGRGHRRRPVRGGRRGCSVPGARIREADVRPGPPPHQGLNLGA